MFRSPRWPGVNLLVYTHPGSSYVTGCSAASCADEHYIPTLLAVKELENETACTGVLTHTHWDGPYLHPKTFGAEDASPATLEGLRAGCRREQLDARQELRRLMPAAWAGNWSAALAARQLPLLALRCPLFARKMDSKAVEGWSKLLQPEL